MDKSGAITFDYDPFEDPEGLSYIDFLKNKFGCNEAPPDPIEPYPIVSRQEWGALPPKDPDMKKIKQPIQIALFWKTKTEECYSQDECKKFLQERQKYDFEENEYNDIQYNFYIGGDGTVYEGRGWEVEADKDSDNYETANRSVDVAYIGTFEDKELSPELIKVGCDLIIWAKKMNFMHEHFNITTLWEDHVHILRPKFTGYNPMDDPVLREEEYKAEFPEPP
ncbi:peptidoglycan-recognition protein 1-like [Macrosteles quadrilineatus]|uniref:peptidoglycan-recognition protein 1-like n=1 Tax=Macrosteles quadrilineatus TaxID=74068 RepID=UPI0023E10051|nr:peptidoglycan-recognition protein 1-like [Macrosteles quadrilineatus]